MKVMSEIAEREKSMKNRWQYNISNSKYTIFERPQLMCDYPLNLSILIRGGKETKWDSLSSGERNGKSSARRVMDFTVH